jgi:transcriptional antiterminator RfaH
MNLDESDQSGQASLTSLSWHVVHTKPRQELRAQENLINQGYECFLPMIRVQKARQGRLHTVDEPMFSRYLFARFNPLEQSWGAIRSTLGVARLVSFGQQPAKVPDEIIEFLRQAPEQEVRKMFAPGDAIDVKWGALEGAFGTYDAHDGELWAFVLIDFLGKPTRFRVALDELRLAV